MHTTAWRSRTGGREAWVPIHRYGLQCSAQSRAGYWCTRAPGHTGRHVAAGIAGNVYEVWRQE